MAEEEIEVDWDEGAEVAIDWRGPEGDDGEVGTGQDDDVLSLDGFEVPEVISKPASTKRKASISSIDNTSRPTPSGPKQAPPSGPRVPYVRRPFNPPPQNHPPSGQFQARPNNPNFRSNSNGPPNQQQGFQGPAQGGNNYGRQGSGHGVGNNGNARPPFNNNNGGFNNQRGPVPGNNQSQNQVTPLQNRQQTPSQTNQRSTSGPTTGSGSNAKATVPVTTTSSQDKGVEKQTPGKSAKTPITATSAPAASSIKAEGKPTPTSASTGGSEKVEGKTKLVVAEKELETPLPEGWTSFESRKNNKVFYYHKASKQTVWVRPTVDTVVENRPESPPLPPTEEEGTTGEPAKVEEEKVVVQEAVTVKEVEKETPTGPSATGVVVPSSTDTIASAYARRVPRADPGAGKDVVPRGPRDVGGERRRPRSSSPGGRGDEKRFRGDERERERNGRSPPRSAMEPRGGRIDRRPPSGPGIAQNVRPRSPPTNNPRSSFRSPPPPSSRGYDNRIQPANQGQTQNRNDGRGPPLPSPIEPMRPNFAKGANVAPLPTNRWGQGQSQVNAPTSAPPDRLNSSTGSRSQPQPTATELARAALLEKEKAMIEELKKIEEEKAKLEKAEKDEKDRKQKDRDDEVRRRVEDDDRLRRGDREARDGGRGDRGFGRAPPNGPGNGSSYRPGAPRSPPRSLISRLDRSPPSRPYSRPPSPPLPSRRRDSPPPGPHSNRRSPPRARDREWENHHERRDPGLRGMRDSSPMPSGPRESRGRVGQRDDLRPNRPRSPPAMGIGMGMNRPRSPPSGLAPAPMRRSLSREPGGAPRSLAERMSVVGGSSGGGGRDRREDDRASGGRGGAPGRRW